MSQARAAIKQVFIDPPPSNERLREVYQHFHYRKHMVEELSRKQRTLLALLRSGHHHSLKAYHHRTDPDISPTCPTCGEADHDLIHWLQECKAHEDLRNEVFGTTKASLKWLSTRPLQVISFAERTLSLSDKGFDK